jgi:hypothetical protein
MAAFQMPIFGGALAGWIFGAALHTSTAGGRLFDFFASLITERAAHSAAMGAIIGGFCLASIYASTYMATRQLTLREKVQTGAGWGATAGWFIGALYHLWSTDSVLPSLTQTALTTTGSLLTN